MRRTLITAASTAALATIALGSAQVAFASEVPVSRGVCHAPKIRPKIIVLAVDGSAAVSGYSHDGHVGYSPGPTANLHWTTSTSRQGLASGYLWVDDSYPSIGGGMYYAVPASIHVWRPVQGVFKRLTITPHGSARFNPDPYWVNPKTVKYNGCKLR